MFPKETCLRLFFCFLVQSKTVSVSDKVNKATLTSVLDDTTPQLADQTFNINNWGLGTTEQKLLADIKAKIDSLSEKGKLLYNSKQSSKPDWDKSLSCLKIFINITNFWLDFQSTNLLAQKAGFFVESLVSSSLTSQLWTGATLAELARIWEGTWP